MLPTSFFAGSTGAFKRARTASARANIASSVALAALSRAFLGISWRVTARNKVKGFCTAALLPAMVAAKQHKSLTSMTLSLRAAGDALISMADRADELQKLLAEQVAEEEAEREASKKRAAEAKEKRQGAKKAKVGEGEEKKDDSDSDSDDSDSD